MNQLEQTINSREVAKMVERNHADVMRDAKKIISHLAESKIASGEYFIESTYLDANKQERPCFDFTKKGCELYSTRMTGAKGTQFAVAYIERFNQMENHIQQQFEIPTTLPEALRLAADVTEQNETLKLENKISEQIISELKPKADYYDSILRNKNLVTITVIAKNYGMSGTEMNKLLHDLKIQYKQGTTWLLYRKYQDRGYTHTEMIPVQGTDKPKPSTKWTQKGHIFIYQLLKENGILPMIEQ